MRAGLVVAVWVSCVVRVSDARAQNIFDDQPASNPAQQATSAAGNGVGAAQVPQRPNAPQFSPLFSGTSNAGPRITQARVYVNGNDQASFKRALNVAIQLSQTYSIPVRTLTQVGTYVDQSVPVEWQASDHDITLDYQPDVPEELGVTQSPVWVLETVSGSIILEAYDDPRNLLKSDGTFLMEKARLEPGVVSAKKQG